jgi:hypothetical protein
MRLVQRLLAYRGSEALITLNLRALNQWFLQTEEKYGHVDELFGSPSWRDCRNMPPAEKEEYLKGLYRRQLAERTTFHIRDFCMTNRFNQPAYFLVYATHSPTGLAVMKQAMRAVDPSGSFSYSDITNPKQPWLFGKEFDAAHGQDLAQELLAKYAGLEVTKEALEQFVDAHERYVGPHLTLALGLMVSQFGVTASSAKRGRGWPTGTHFRFPSNRPS